MRILRVYTSVGILVGILGTISLLKTLSLKVYQFAFILVLIINIWSFYANTWISLLGWEYLMGDNFIYFFLF